MKTTDFITENQFIGDDAHAMYADHEVQMARGDCYNAAKYAIELHKLLKNVSEMHGLDGWVSEKITLANDYLRTVHEYLTHEMSHPQEVMPEMFTAESAEIQFAELLDETTGKQVDMTGKKCTACKKGTYQETSQHDDMDGVVHCTKCRKQVKRHQPANPNKKGMSEGKPQKKADRYHINKDGKPASLASYADKSSAVKDRDARYPDAKVHQVGPRGKVKGEFEEGRRLDLSSPEEKAARKAYIKAHGHPPPLTPDSVVAKYNPGDDIKVRDYYLRRKGIPQDKLDKMKEDGVAEASRGFRGVGGAREREDDERYDLDPSDWYIVKDGKLLKASIYPRQEAQARAEGFSPTREQARARASNKGVAEASPRQHPKRYQSAIDAFNRFMDEPESTPKDELQSRHDQTKKRIKTNTMAGPKGQLPEAGPGDINRLEHRGEEYNVYFNQRKGMYTARGKGQMSGQIQPEWFHTLADAQDHAEMEIGGYDEHDGVDEGRGNPEAISKNKLVHLLKIAVANSNDRREYALMTQAKEMFGDNWADDAYEYAALHNQNLNSDTFLDANNEQMQELAGRLGIKHSDYSSTPGVTETTSSAGMATAPGVGKGPKTGTLFGGSYAPRTPFTGKKKAKTSVIKR